jgi:hypothetical protein
VAIAMLVTNRSRDGRKMLSFSNAQQLLPASIGDGCYEMRKGIVGDRLTAPRRPTPRRVTERDQPRLIASYLTRPAEYAQSEGGGFVAAGFAQISHSCAFLPARKPVG